MHYKGYRQYRRYYRIHLAAAVQAVFDFAEGVIIDKKYSWRQLTKDFIINFATIYIGNFIGGQMIFINGYWIQPQNIGSFFTKSYGKKLLAQTEIGAVIGVLIDLMRKGLQNLGKDKNYEEPKLQIC